MSPTPSATRELFARECSFPTERDAVIDTVGDVVIASPNGDPTDVETVLERSEETNYGSVGELHSTVMANLGEGHVGRKRYDDRSSARRREAELSF
jgi:hypothetical protein